MKIVKSIIGVSVSILLVIFIVQNLQNVSIQFLGMSFNSVPLFLVVIVFFTLGFLCGRISAWAKTITIRR